MRLILLLKKDLVEGRRDYLIYGSIIFIIMLISSLLSMLFNGPYYVPSDATTYPDFFYSFLFVGGFIIASMAFREEMYGKDTQHAWMMIPASPLEKLTVKLLIVSIIYPLALLLFISGASYIIEGINLIFFRAHYEVMNPFTPAVWESILHFIIFSSIFLMGSTYFRKISFLKTILSLSLFALVLGLLALLLGRIIFGNFITQLEFVGEQIMTYDYSGEQPMNFNISSYYHAFRIFEVIGKLIYWVLLAPFCWLVSWFRIREVQAYDAV